MTNPLQHNCSHSDTGWCLDCVQSLGREIDELDEGFEALEMWRHYFGFARLYQCIDGWYVSNKTDEGIGGGDPCIKAFGPTPKEALLAAARFLRDPKIPSPIPCPSCGKPIDIHEYTYNGRELRTSIEFFCWNMEGENCGCIMGDDICPACMGYLDAIEVETPDGVDMRTKWEAKCIRCGKIYPRGDVEIEYPDFKFEKIDLERLLDDDE